MTSKMVDNVLTDTFAKKPQQKPAQKEAAVISPNKTRECNHYAKTHC